jgi:alkylhydroperoxidase family enzyme
MEEAALQALLLQTHAPQLRQLLVVSETADYARQALPYQHHLRHKYWELRAGEGHLSAKLEAVVAKLKAQCLACQSDM